MPTLPAVALASIRQFLAVIGLEVRDVNLPAPSFLPGLLIDQGVLLLDPARLLSTPATCSTRPAIWP